MASRGEPVAKPEVGDTLMVIHDFIARSADELALVKGDRVELIERDDEFGDGWFYGRHLGNDTNGLFPEVYTRLAQKQTPSTAQAPWKPLSPLAEESKPMLGGDLLAAAASLPAPNTSTPVLPLNSAKPESTGPPTTSVPIVAALSRLESSNQDSPVINETLNVINEHITDLRSTPSTISPRSPANDSGSEYSAPLDHRMSYIQGEETDEEEGDSHTRPEVEGWSADEVAEYLFTAGVEKHHCEVFREQDIAGEVLLGMDQSSLFIKAFDLGSVGRRLKTWHKIKSLQDEVNGLGIATRRTTQTYGSDIAPEDAARHRARRSTLTNSISQRPPSVQNRPLVSGFTPKQSPNLQDSSSHLRRPSAASVRDLHHSRRHSSTDYQMFGGNTPRLSSAGTFPATDGHKKQPSFDRNWSIGNAFGSQSPARPLSSAGVAGTNGASDPEIGDSAVDLDRGYFSGGEMDYNKSRNVLRKRDSIAHSRKSSYADEQRVRSATALTRHSRFGSMGSFHENAPPSAAQRYYGSPSGPHRRTASTNTTDSVRPPPPAKDGPPPSVTKLDGKAPPTPTKDGDWFTNLVQKPVSKTGGSIRAISDNLGFDRKARSSTEAASSMKDSSLPSPAPTGSSTPSGGPSFDMENDATKSPITMEARPKVARKGKKETSAYTRGLLKIAPREAAKDADYSGWMRKKSSNLMTTWKPRYFVLKGRRLAYYYSEDDTEEKGLIDISFHRVLPADNEKLTGLHATITGATSGPAMGTGPTDTSLDKGDDVIFIFKLMPPRAGLSRAVNFTKPTVHYFAVPNLKQGRLWMAALMKATIDRDDAQPVTTTYQQKTISLAKAKQMRHRPPALRDLEESREDAAQKPSDQNGLGLFSEADSGVDKIGVASSQPSA